ncbi:ribonuclease P protein component [Kerstersia similis]|uniref:ribonuclease P protein component n=1 Tax=Kerstersia similis TaxID=206505 RepID=UPI0039F12410
MPVRAVAPAPAQFAAESSASFPPSARLHSPEEFAPALKGRRVARGALLVLTSVDNAAGHSRLGLVIPKRHAARAVTRNTIKRVVRDTFRQLRLQLPPRDFVMRLHGKAPLVSLSELKRQVRAEAEAHFQRALPCSRNS